MSDAEALKVILPFLGSAAPLGLFAWMVHRLLERTLKAQARREEVFEAAAEARATAQAARDGALLQFMGMLEERTRPLAVDGMLTPPMGIQSVPPARTVGEYHLHRRADEARARAAAAAAAAAKRYTDDEEG